MLPYKQNLIIAFATFLFVNECQVTSRHSACFIFLCRIRNIFRSDNSPLSFAPCSITRLLQDSSEMSVHGVVFSETIVWATPAMEAWRLLCSSLSNTSRYPQDECRNVSIHLLVRYPTLLSEFNQKWEMLQIS